MPEADNASKAQKEFYVNVPQESRAFFLKGSNAHDWGMNNRLARIFNPQSGKAVMLAFDHGYFQGPTTGLERVDISILPLAPYADALMLTQADLADTATPPTAARTSGIAHTIEAKKAIRPTTNWMTNTLPIWRRPTLHPSDVWADRPESTSSLRWVSPPSRMRLAGMERNSASMTALK